MPKSKKQWIVNLSAEFVGTIFLTWMIALLGVTFGGNLFEKMISFTTANSDGVQWEGVSNLVIGFWVGMDVMLCLAFFSRWSCDLNPAVTTYRMLSKQNSLKYGFAKIGVQVLAAFAAAGLIIGTQALSHAVSGNAIDALHAYAVKDINTGKIVRYVSDMNAAHSLTESISQISTHTWSAFLDNTSSATAAPSTFPRHLLALIGEIVGVTLLLYPIFTRSIKTPVLKDILIVLVIGFGVAALLELKTVGWNPARSLATTIAYDIINPGLHATKLYWAYLFGPIIAAFMLFGLQKLNVKEIFNTIWEKWLSFGSLGPVPPVDAQPHHTEEDSAIHGFEPSAKAKAKTAAKKQTKKQAK